MERCYVCLEYIDNIPLLKCNHFVCCNCYCDMKNQKLNNCLICQKKLIRGTKKNK